MPFNDWWDQSGASGGVSVPGSVAAPASPLYVGPSSRSNTFAVLGDSISAHNSVYAAPSPSASNVIAFNNYGYLAWARALSGGAISFNPVNNFGVGGDTIAPSTAGPGATTRVSQVIASGVKNCCVEIGINDIDLTPTPTPLSSMMSNTALICSQLVNAGVTVYLFTLVPCGSLKYSSVAKPTFF